MSVPVYLLNGVTVDTDGDPKNIRGIHALIIEGDLGGGTVALEVRHADDASEWRTAKDDNGLDYSFTDKADTPVTVAGFSSLQFRATLNGSSGADCTVKFV
jgi:hypothetical protein